MARRAARALDGQPSAKLSLDGVKPAAAVVLEAIAGLAQCEFPLIPD